MIMLCAVFCNPSTWEAEARESPGLLGEFQDSLGYRVRSYLKNNSSNNSNNGDGVDVVN